MKKNNILKSFLILSLFFTITLAGINICKAQTLKNAFGSDSALNNIANKAGYSETSVNLEGTIGKILTILFSFLGVIFLVLMIYGGYLWMMAKGDESQVTKAKNIIIGAVIGLMIILLSYAISYFVIKNVGEKTLKNSSGGSSGFDSPENGASYGNNWN